MMLASSVNEPGCGGGEGLAILRLNVFSHDLITNSLRPGVCRGNATIDPYQWSPSFSLPRFLEAPGPSLAHTLLLERRREGYPYGDLS